MAAGIEPPRRVFGHGFVYIKNEETGDVQKISKSLGNVVEPMDIITKFSAEAFRYYFLRECPFPGDGEFSWQRFAEVCNADLANNLGNLYSRRDAAADPELRLSSGGHREPGAGRVLHRHRPRNDRPAGAGAHRGVPVQSGAAT